MALPSLVPAQSQDLHGAFAFANSGDSGTAASTLRAYVHADAEQRWATCEHAEEGELPYEDGRGIDVQLVVVGPRRALALVSTPCHRSTEGAYNFVSSLVEVSGSRVRPARFAGHGRPARPTEITNGGLFVRRGQVYLTSGFKYRSVYDAGHDALHRWEQGRFVLVERRSRGGGAHSPIDTEEGVGPFPITAPPRRACFPTLQLVSPEQMVISATSGRGRVQHRFPISERNCRERTPLDESIDCHDDGAPHDLAVTYTVVPRDDDWVVLRLTGAPLEASEVLRAPRDCPL